jgi:hydroxylamine reductase (hybrid-cluster protein)
MKVVQKKSVDAATNAMLVKANRRQTELAWDRAEAMQPQCGFGRMSICCSDCNEGPCRTNPFDTKQQLTICGRSQAEQSAGYFIRQAMDGASALVSLACEFDADIDKAFFRTVSVSKDSMLAPVDYYARLIEIGGAAAGSLKAIAAVKEKTFGKAGPAETAANMGSLKADAVNIVLHGHIAPKTVKGIAESAEAGGVPVNVTAMCGSETGSGFNLPVLTNYCSQEAPLLTGAVDLLVVGSQCVMPAVVSLAKQLNVPVVNSSELSSSSEIKKALQTASNAFLLRAGKRVDIPACTEKVFLGYTAANSKPLFSALNAGYAQGSVKGIAYIGGCGSVAETQDAQFIKLADRLLADNYLIVTSGCAGAALAKAGMCSPDYAAGEGLKSILPSGVPPVLYAGSCHDAGEFLLMAQAVKESGMPVYAFMPEMVHNKVLATAIAFAAEGITAHIDTGEAELIPDVRLKGKLLPISDFRQLTGVLTEAAAAK